MEPKIGPINIILYIDISLNNQGFLNSIWGLLLERKEEEKKSREGI